VWLGVTAEDQQRANRNIPLLLNIPAAVHFASCEPMLGAIDLGRWLSEWLPHHERKTLDWVIVGGESGPSARPMRPDWARSIRDQCEAARVPFFMKQMTKKVPIPADLLVREMPCSLKSPL
jgi:protein gp37